VSGIIRQIEMFEAFLSGHGKVLENVNKLHREIQYYYEYYIFLRWGPSMTKGVRLYLIERRILASNSGNSIFPRFFSLCSCNALIARDPWKKWKYSWIINNNIHNIFLFYWPV
jgi:hypothetical protein